MQVMSMHLNVVHRYCIYIKGFEVTKKFCFLSYLQHSDKKCEKANKHLNLKNAVLKVFICLRF